MILCDLKKALISILAVVLFTVGIFNFSAGVNAPKEKPNVDLQTRAKEYDDFSKGIYPNRRLQREDNVRAKSHTVYPPYALPMFALVFGNWSFPTASLLIQVCSILALCAMMVLGWRSLREQGTAAAALGASLPWAFSGITLAVSKGQFSMLCMGLLAMQILCLMRKMQLLAGICWAFAMLKPQIALPFALLFLPGRQWQGLLAGTGLLAVLSTGALWWTRTGLREFVQTVVLGQKLDFVDQSKFSIGFFVDAMGLSPSLAVVSALLAFLFLGAVAWRYAKHLKISLLMVAAIASVIGHSFFYHRRYDNMMLLPLALSLALLFFKGGYKLKEYMVYGAFFVSVFSSAEAVFSNPFIMTMMPILALALVPFTVRGLRQQNQKARKT
jgi:hypothetical protein